MLWWRQTFPWKSIYSQCPWYAIPFNYYWSLFCSKPDSSLLTHCYIGISFYFVYDKYAIITFEMPNVTYHGRFIPRRQTVVSVIPGSTQQVFAYSVTLLVLVTILHSSFILGFKSVTQPLVVQVIYLHLHYQYKISFV